MHQNTKTITKEFSNKKFSNAIASGQVVKLESVKAETITSETPNVTNLLGKKDMTEEKAKNLLKEYINSQCK